MTELNFAKKINCWESDPIWADADFIVNLSFDKEDQHGNEIQIQRSVTGEDYVIGWRTKYEDAHFELTFTGIGSGTYVKVVAKNKPKGGYFA